MINNPNIQKFGYTEMYEWTNTPDLLTSKSGLFVQFNNTCKDRIEPYRITKEEETGIVRIPVFCGITTENAIEESDNPEEWHGKYKIDEYGNYVLHQKYIAVGNKEYDQHNELSFIRTFPYSVLKKTESDKYNKDEQYRPRNFRIEWQHVCLLGKCTIIDNGNCEPGDFIVPYTGNVYELAGTGVKYDSSIELHDKLPKFYVLSRVSDKAVMVVVK